MDCDQEQRHRCAAWAREVGLAPAGTAPHTDVFVLVEHPLPWPKDVGEDPLLSVVAEAARGAAPGRTVRLQALAAEPSAPTRRVVVFATTDGPFRGYGRLEGVGLPDELPGLAAALVTADPPAPTAGVTDVLVCTHGTRDTCCGSLGTRLWRDAEGGGPRVWRTSHTGGHRFAPTAVTLPDGCYWAFLDPGLLASIVDRRLPADEAAAHLRGCAAFSPAVQVADAAALANRGWDWLSTARLGAERSARRVELCFETSDLARGSVDVCLAEGRRMPVPECGQDPVTATKSHVEVAITRVQVWA
jgi:hypothetical protein